MNSKLKATLVVGSTFLLGAIVGALINGAIMSQKSETFRARPPGPLFAEIIERALQPDESQRQAISGILKRHSERVEAEIEQSRERMSEIMNALQSELDPLLTPEQRRRLRDNMQRPFARRVVNFGKEPVEVLKEQLDLSEKQTDEIQKIFDDVERAKQALVEGERLDTQSMRQKMTELHNRIDEQIKHILSPEQLKKYDTIRELLPVGIPHGGGALLFREGDERPPWDSTMRQRSVR